MSGSMEETSGSRRRDDESSSEEVMTTQVKDLYETKSTSKAVRVFTVLAYLLSVSFAAILLSVYYIFIWVPPQNKEASPLRDNGAAVAQMWTTSVTLADFTVPGDPPVSTTAATDTSPYTAPPVDTDNSSTLAPDLDPAASTYDTTPQDVEPQTINKHTSKRKRRKDPE